MSSTGVHTFEAAYSPSHAIWLLAVCSIAAVSVIAYFPAVDNFFISDDFALLPYLGVLDGDPLKIIDTPSELFRLVSYVFFWVCLKVFGPAPEAWYWSGIALHVIASLLVFRLAFRVTGDWAAAWAAAVFFAGYERHQEAVMWISAFNDLILTVNCLLFLTLWVRAFHASALAKRYYVAAVFVYCVALFSKEGAVALFPLAVLWLGFTGYRFRQIATYSLPLFFLLLAYIALWLSQADKNFFVADGHYAFGLHFIPVYLRTFTRLASPLLLFVAPLAFALYRRGPLPGRTLHRSRGFSFPFFAALLALSILPYSFLTYMDHIPSRNTYFPSVGLAGLVGIVFAMLYGELKSRGLRQACVVFLTFIVAGNVAYIWLKKEPQFRARSAPTKELVDFLNALDGSSLNTSGIRVCGFPLPSWYGQLAIAGFTEFDAGRVAFVDHCDETANSISLNWDDDTGRYRQVVPD